VTSKRREGKCFILECIWLDYFSKMSYKMNMKILKNLLGILNILNIRFAPINLI